MRKLLAARANRPPVPFAGVPAGSIVIETHRFEVSEDAVRPSIRRTLTRAFAIGATLAAVSTVALVAAPAQAYEITWYGPYGYYECEAAYDALMNSGAPVPRTVTCQYHDVNGPGWYYGTLG
ncbi:hypothetical protein [Micromonospora cathayae]|uniref:Uncharacterized protein n=1 Tax=Micromonospora cathayae TaxID=3028804 RepID=A0ABY7ZIV9_9ACTN|nr:hypothetical protein [Micromonospora sp. HUAS 3]WDZ82802.1 hypothetical protein PVK37_20270 [Micromonospora sp. HUAS 3]